MANENTVSITYTADGSAAITASNSVADGSAAAVDRMTKSTQDAAGAQATTWKQFVAERMSEYMRVEGGHAAAMKRMSAEWAVYKASGVTANQQVAAAANTASNSVAAGSAAATDRMTRGAESAAAAQKRTWQQYTDERLAEMLRLQQNQVAAVERMTAEWNAYRNAGAGASGNVNKGIAETGNVVDMLAGKVRTLAAEATAAFGAFKLAALGKDATMFAANVEQADRALSVIANNMGKTSAEAIKTRDHVRDLGITTNSATNATAQFLRSELPTEKLETLARAAQGAAISYSMMTGEAISSSEALDKMIRSIVTGNVTELHTLGINVLLRDELREYRQETGEAAASVDSHRRHQMLLNAALEQSQPLLNLYVNSMDLTSKKISSSKRPVEELKLAMGQLFLPELSVAASVFYDTVSGGMTIVRSHTAELSAARQMIKDVSEGLVAGAVVIGVYAAGVTAATVVTAGLSAGAGVFTGVLALLTTQVTLTGTEAVVASTKIGVMGEAIATTSTVATVGLNSIKAAAGVLAAFFVGWEFGKMLSARFETVRDAGTTVVWGLVRGWNEVGWAAQKAIAHMDMTTSHEQTQQIIKDIEAERQAWITMWQSTKAEQMRDNASNSDTGTKPPYQDNQAAIAAGQAAEKERIRKEQELRAQAAAQAADKERKRQDEIAIILATAREEQLLIGKTSDEKELLRLDLKQQKELKALRDKHASVAQIEELQNLQSLTRIDLVNQQALEKRRAAAVAETEVARKAYEEQSAWLAKLDAFQVKTGQMSSNEALSRSFDRERQTLALKLQELDTQIELETKEKKRLELIGQRKNLEEQIKQSYVQQGQQIALNVAEEESGYQAHQVRMLDIYVAGEIARLNRLGQERAALTAYYAWEEEKLKRTLESELSSITSSQAEKLAAERIYQEKLYALRKEKSEKFGDLENNQKKAIIASTQQTFGYLASAADAFYAASNSKSIAAFRAYQMLKSAETVIATASASMKAFDVVLKETENYYAAGAAAAAVALYGAGQLAAIWSASPGGGSNSTNLAPSAGSGGGTSGSGGSSSGSGGAVQTAAPSTINVHIYGIADGYYTDWDAVTRDKITPAVLKAINDGVH